MKTPTLEELLVPSHEIKLHFEGHDEPISMWIRPPDNMEQQAIQGAARLASRSMRKQLEDTESEMYALLVESEIGEYSDEQLRQLWVAGKSMEEVLRIKQESLEEREYVPEPEGDVVDGKEIDKYENDLEDAEERREKAVEQALRAAHERLSKEALEFNREHLELVGRYAIVDRVCSSSWNDEYQRQLAYRCTFKDRMCLERAFPDMHQIRLIQANHPKVFDQLLSAHLGLLVDPAALGNSDAAAKLWG